MEKSTNQYGKRTNHYGSETCATWMLKALSGRTAEHCMSVMRRD